MLLAEVTNLEAGAIGAAIVGVVGAIATAINAIRKQAHSQMQEDDVRALDEYKKLVRDQERRITKLEVKNERVEDEHKECLKQNWEMVVRMKDYEEALTAAGIHFKSFTIIEKAVLKQQSPSVNTDHPPKIEGPPHDT